MNRQKINSESIKHVFLNFTKGGCQWLCDEIILNETELVETSKMFYNNRINFENVLDIMFETAHEIENDMMEISL